jgi:hypothetical protein
MLGHLVFGQGTVSSGQIFKFLDGKGGGPQQMLRTAPFSPLFFRAIMIDNPCCSAKIVVIRKTIRIGDDEHSSYN